MHLPSRRRLKKQLSRKLIYHPLLRMLLFKVWFRTAFLLLLLLAALLALITPKIWTSSPDGFHPVVKVSGLDLIQARSLRRAAVRAEADGRIDDSCYAWLSAAANNTADPRAIRGLLSTLLRADRVDHIYIRAGIAQSLWLLRLTQTNQADLDLTVQLTEKHRNFEVLLYILQPRENQLAPSHQAVYLKALFHRGQLAAFAKLHQQFKANLQDPELPLYDAALKAGWGDPAGAPEATAVLTAASQIPQYRLLANRLLLIVSSHLADAAAFERYLDELVQQHEDTLLDHIAYWNLLAALDRTEEAKRLAQAYPNVPLSGQEIARLAELYLRVDLPDHAIRLLDQFAATFGHSQDVWLVYGKALLAQKQWDKLRSVAIQMRQQQAVRLPLTGFSHYLEGRAELGQARTGLAEQCFDRAAAAEFPFAQGLSIAKELADLNFPKPAMGILEKLHTEGADQAEYWETRFKTAFALKNPELILLAAQKGFELQPKNPAQANRYAAALLLNRVRPDEAVKLTWQLISEFPGSAASSINHALALLLNRRTEEARTLLAEIDPEQLAPAHRSSYYLAWFEVFSNLNNAAAAESAYLKIDPQHLLPSQIRWLDERRRQLASAPPPGS